MLRSGSCLLVLTFLGAAPAGAQTLQEFSGTRPGHPEVVLFGDGGVRNVVGQPSDATSTTGSLGVTFRGSRYVVTGVVNVLARSDTITAGYGASMLAPASGRAFESALLEVRRPHLFGYDARCADGDPSRMCQLGLRAYVAASATRWGYQKNAEGVPAAVADVPVWATGLGGYYRFFDGFVGDSNRVAMGLDVTWATRHVRGDLAASDAAAVNARTTILGSTRVNFDGLETGLNIRYNEIDAGLTYYWFSGQIAGFSGGQIVAAISVRARLNSGPFTSLLGR